MAKNYFLLFLLFTASSSFAQIKVGLIGGPQSAGITEKNNIAGWDSATGKYYTNKSGLHVGVMLEMPLAPGSRFYFQPSVMYSEKGRNFASTTHIYQSDSVFTNTTNSTLNVKYIDVPLNVEYKLPLTRKKTTNFILSAGPYLSFFYDGKNSVTQYNSLQSNDNSYSKVTSTVQELEVGKKDDSYKLLTFGVNGRAGFEFGNVTLTGFYSQGLSSFYYAPYAGTFKHKVYGASLGIWLAQIKEPVVVKDKDNDGIPDDKDACPLQPGTAITNGCPDKDGDGIADNKDKCPDVAGLVKYNGCPVPDTDNDGVNDEEDKCPTIAGIAKYNGCPIPDTDKDGINDEEDKCPTVAGSAKYNGCPVPDKDNDGVNDEEDKCPDVAGEAGNGGCPVIKEDIKKQVDFAAENIFFQLNSAQLLTTSYKPLQTVADLLKANPSLQLSVNGYTDNTGTVAGNLTMSVKRASAVKDYLVKQGVDAARISANGYGIANPVADNKTAAGRTKNRRVELKLKQ